uniref:Uncharacterized protein n=2 Tax=Clastoptera arizonana TaxID=38151 RepID=A0A1B6C6Y0_9HEMI
MAKQWAGRIVLTVQCVCWIAVSCLLFHRGFTNIRQQKTYENTTEHKWEVPENGTEVEEGRSMFTLSAQSQVGRSLASSVVMIVVAVVMLAVSPAFIALKLLEIRRRNRRVLKALQRDQPPKYEDVIDESVPRYSSLFKVSENGDFSLDDGKVKAEVNPEQVPLTLNNQV